MDSLKICVLGLGYIGLPTASIFATKGFQVLGVDVNQDVVTTINGGGIHIVEPDLDVLVRSAVNSGNFRASLEPEQAHAFIIAVPTPFKHEDAELHTPDLRYVESATAAIAPHLEPGNLVVLESTSPVGTTERIASLLHEARPELRGKIHVAHCPERVLPGHILKELVDNDRIVGGIDKASTEAASKLYRRFVNGQIFETDARTAEMAKLTENSFRDVNIAFANELSLICDELRINVWELISLANRHPRVNILQPGPGVGGHCIAVDPWFVVSRSPQQARLIRTAREVNDHKPDWVVEKVREHARRFKEPVIAVLGLSYKANIDDLRESPSVDILKRLAVGKEGRLLTCEPYIHALPKELSGLPGIELVDLDVALDAADIVLLLVNHNQFRDVDREKLKQKIVIDTRGVW